MDTAAVVPSTAGVVNDDDCAPLQLWASSVGFGGEVGRLMAARRELSSVLAEAQGKEIQNKALALQLREAWDQASRAADLLSALEYYRIQEQMEHGDDSNHKLLDGDMSDQNVRLSTPGSDINNDIAEAAEDTTESSVRNEDSTPSALQIVPYIGSTMVVGNTSSVSHLEILDKDISREISDQVQECRRITMRVHEALELENLDYHIVQKFHSSVTDPRETSPCHTYPKVHGRGQERDFIIRKLTSEESTRKNLSVLAIIGHGGIGKTTLAKLVFNNSVVSKHFDILLWVYVSVHFNQATIMRELLETLSGNKHENIKESKALQEKLEYMLKSKRVLLVMDDTWEDSQKEKWDEVLHPLLNNDVNGNTVLVTTRKPSVAILTGASNCINLDGLNKGDFWCLFKECAFGDENYKGEPRLQRIGQQIVQKLKGNPLAAKTLGKVLRRREEF